VADVGTELEFILFADTYDEAARRDYHGLTPANGYNVDYSLMGTAKVEPVLRRIRNGMAGAGMVVESAKGECNLGQHEIAFRYADALTTCDNHVVYKTGAKEIADRAGMALTFMAKYDAREGNSCHVHVSLRGEDGNVFPGDGRRGWSPLFEQFLAGQQRYLRELTCLFAPNINSYKRFAEGSFAPTAVGWGVDNRTCALRVVGHGPGLRVENRVPGGDMNPYLGVAALIAAGLAGIEEELPLPPELTGNAYTSDAPRVPGTLREAADLFAGSALARSALGDEVVDHYAHAARVELTAFDAAVTDWERRRGFERL
jgi:glutamine synthetase